MVSGGVSLLAAAVVASNVAGAAGDAGATGTLGALGALGAGGIAPVLGGLGLVGAAGAAGMTLMAMSECGGPGTFLVVYFTVFFSLLPVLISYCPAE